MADCAHAQTTIEGRLGEDETLPEGWVRPVPEEGAAATVEEPRLPEGSTDPQLAAKVTAKKAQKAEPKKVDKKKADQE